MLQSMKFQRAGHDLVTEPPTSTSTTLRRTQHVNLVEMRNSTRSVGRGVTGGGSPGLALIPPLRFAGPGTGDCSQVTRYPHIWNPSLPWGGDRPHILLAALLAGRGGGYPAGERCSCFCAFTDPTSEHICAQSHSSLCNPTNCIPPGSSAMGFSRQE